jgi:hypothetical protein
LNEVDPGIKLLDRELSSWNLYAMRLSLVDEKCFRNTVKFKLSVKTSEQTIWKVCSAAEHALKH